MSFVLRTGAGEEKRSFVKHGVRSVVRNKLRFEDAEYAKFWDLLSRLQKDERAGFRGLHLASGGEVLSCRAAVTAGPEAKERPIPSDVSRPNPELNQMLRLANFRRLLLDPRCR